MSKWTNKTLRTVKDWPLEIVEAGEEGKPIGGSIYEAEDRKRFAHPIVSINHAKLTDFAHRLTDKEEAKALAARVVDTFNACTGITFTGDSAGVVGEMRLLLHQMANGYVQHDTDEDGCHYPASWYKGRKGGQDIHCEGCKWEKTALAVLERVRVEEER